MNEYALRGNLVTPFEMILNGQIEVEDGVITYVGLERNYRNVVLDYKTKLICPGFIDIHVHGGAGVDVMDSDPDALKVLSTYLAGGGVTGFLGTTHTTTLDELKNALYRIKAARNLGLPGARMLGAHVEGPFISQRKRGAQDRRQVRGATEQELDTLYKASGETIRIMTLAPETRNALKAAGWLVSRGIVAAAGHTNATYDYALHAFDKGFTHLSHFYNGMRRFHHREPGIVGAGLTDDRVTLELVADEIHVHPSALRLALLTKGSHKIALVSDSVKPAGLPDGEHNFDGMMYYVRGRTITVEGGVIAGSGIRLNDSIKVMVEKARSTILEAIQMASSTPAKILKLTPSKGELILGSNADFAVLDWDYKVLRTIIGGKTVYEAEKF